MTHGEYLRRRNSINLDRLVRESKTYGLVRHSSWFAHPPVQGAVSPRTFLHARQKYYQS
jgi:hypothetical protein